MKKDKLLELINSLTKNEKRNFKLYSKRYSEDENPLYVELFDYIYKYQSVDEASILSHFKITKTNFRFYKNYLYESIIRCLIATKNDKSITLQLYEWLEMATLLIEKKMYQEALSYLKKVLNDTHLLDSPLSIHVYNLMKICVGHPKEVKILNEKEKKAIAQAQNLNEIYERILNDENCDDIEPLGLSSKSILLHQNVILALRAKDLERLKTNYTLFLECMKDNTAFLQMNCKGIVYSLTAYNLLLLKEKHYEDYAATLKEVKDLIVKSKDEECLFIFRRQEFVLAVVTGHFNHAEALLNLLKSAPPYYCSETDLIYLNSFIALYYFYKKEFKLLKQILKANQKAEYTTHFLRLHSLKILLALEEGDLIYAKSLLSSIYYYKHQQDKIVYQILALIVNFHEKQNHLGSSFYQKLKEKLHQFYSKNKTDVVHPLDINSMV